MEGNSDGPVKGVDEICEDLIEEIALRGESGESLMRHAAKNRKMNCCKCFEFEPEMKSFVETMNMIRSYCDRVQLCQYSTVNAVWLEILIHPI